MYDYDNAEGTADELRAAYAPKPSLAKRPSNDPVVLNNIAIHQANLEEGHVVASTALKLTAEDTLLISDIALPTSSASPTALEVAFNDHAHTENRPEEAMQPTMTDFN